MGVISCSALRVREIRSRFGWPKRTGQASINCSTAPTACNAPLDWSPDGRFIAFDSLGADGHWHVWIVDAEGGQPHQVVVDAGDQQAPTWSHDGHWIYFWSEQNIWRVPATGGRREQLTQGGAWEFACESADGKNLLYQSSKGKGGALMTVPLSGGPARQVLACVSYTAFIAGAKGIYYVACDAGPDPPVHLLDPYDWPDSSAHDAGRLNTRMHPIWPRRVTGRQQRLIRQAGRRRRRLDADRELPLEVILHANLEAERITLVAGQRELTIAHVRLHLTPDDRARPCRAP